MNDLKLAFDSAELKVLYNVFGMLKYGVEDEYKMLKVISSSIFQELFTEIHRELINYQNDRALNNAQTPINENIEDYPKLFNILKVQVQKCIEMHKGSTEGNWSEWKQDWKREMIVNLARPYLIKESTIDEILSDYI
jgi:hypothetical protein